MLPARRVSGMKKMKFGFPDAVFACWSGAAWESAPAMDAPRKLRRDVCAIDLSSFLLLSTPVRPDFIPRRYPAALRPGTVLADQLVGFVGHPGRQVIHFRAVGLQVVEFPVAGISRYQLPLAVEGG